MWRRSVDFGVIEDVRQISVRIRDHFAQNAHIGPGFDLKRGRGGIREVEFFVQIQQMIHGGRDPVGALPATLDAIAALAGGGPSRADDRAQPRRGLSPAADGRAPGADGRRRARPTCCRPTPAALDNVARLHGLADGDALLALVAPARRGGRARCSTG